MITQQQVVEYLASVENRALVLEIIMDREPMGVAGMVEEMANVAHAKADHVRENWQDDGLAWTWDCIGRRLSGLRDSGSFVRLVREAGATVQS